MIRTEWNKIIFFFTLCLIPITRIHTPEDLFPLTWLVSKMIIANVFFKFLFCFWRKIFRKLFSLFEDVKIFSLFVCLLFHGLTFFYTIIRIYVYIYKDKINYQQVGSQKFYTEPREAKKLEKNKQQITILNNMLHNYIVYSGHSTTVGGYSNTVDIYFSHRSPHQSFDASRQHRN